MRFYKFLIIICRPIIYLLFPYKILNKNSLPKNKGVILCCNHISYIDPIYLIFGQPKHHISFLAKAELFKVPVFSFILKKVGVIGIKRGSGDTAAIDRAVEVLKNGRVLGIFPEGTRSKTGEPLRPRSGAAVLALRTGADVMPAAVICQGRVRPFKKVTVVFGDIIKNEDLGLEKDNPSTINAASKKIMEAIIKLMEEHK